MKVSHPSQNAYWSIRLIGVLFLFVLQKGALHGLDILDVRCTGSCIRRSRGTQCVGNDIDDGNTGGRSGARCGWPVSGRNVHFQLEEVMITIHSFEEAHQLWQQGRLPFRLLQETSLILLGITQEDRHIEHAYDISEVDIEGLLQHEIASEKYVDFLGGEFKIVETESDLAEIHFGEGFDISEPLAEKIGEAMYWYLVLCTSNSGGISYLTPRHLWKSKKMAAEVDLWNAEK